ncbi:hypothetical protein TIFTF001_017908 [Ficus carica]|uniref:Uncharacterized protein n=1 Tax=Ficus carica TaxID=3494 RepID=A0AA88A8T9_FICCA|nr:hypothetical protein TIFTF001_017908 [Ficus carica]
MPSPPSLSLRRWLSLPPFPPRSDAEDREIVSLSHPPLPPSPQIDPMPDARDHPRLVCCWGPPLPTSVSAPRPYTTPIRGPPPPPPTQKKCRDLVLGHPPPPTTRHSGLVGIRAPSKSDMGCVRRGGVYARRQRRGPNDGEDEGGLRRWIWGGSVLDLFGGEGGEGKARERERDGLSVSGVGSREREGEMAGILLRRRTCGREGGRGGEGRRKREKEVLSLFIYFKLI